MDYEDDDDKVLPWRLTWVDPVRWGLNVVSCIGQVLTRVSDNIMDDLVSHAHFVKTREDFAAEAGLEIEALVKGEK